jgi:hypothetical protein
MRFLLRVWVRNGLRKCRPLRIDTIGKLVAFVVSLAIDLKVNRKNLSLNQSCKHSAANTLISLWVPAILKKALPNSEVLICHRFKHHTIMYVLYTILATQMSGSSNTCIGLKEVPIRAAAPSPVASNLGVWMAWNVVLPPTHVTFSKYGCI